MNTAVALVAILTGSGAIAGGLWKTGRAIARRAIADAELKRALVYVTTDHERRIKRLERGKTGGNQTRAG